MDAGTSLVVQLLRLPTPNAGGPGLILGWGIKSHVLQLKILHEQLRPGEINKYYKERKWNRPHLETYTHEKSELSITNRVHSLTH